MLWMFRTNLLWRCFLPLYVVLIAFVLPIVIYWCRWLFSRFEKVGIHRLTRTRARSTTNYAQDAFSPSGIYLKACAKKISTKTEVRLVVTVFVCAHNIFAVTSGGTRTLRNGLDSIPEAILYNSHTLSFNLIKLKGMRWRCTDRVQPLAIAPLIPT